jgi:hypothetical protein
MKKAAISPVPSTAEIADAADGAALESMMRNYKFAPEPPETWTVVSWCGKHLRLVLEGTKDGVPARKIITLEPGACDVYGTPVVSVGYNEGEKILFKNTEPCVWTMEKMPQ